jgi:hypothetical protein
MNKFLHPILAIAFLTFSLAACNSAKGPKEVSAAFITSLYTLQFDEAAQLTTPATKALLEKGRQEATARGIEATDDRSEAAVSTLFTTDKLLLSETGNAATVQNDVLSIPLKKEGGEWKVAVSEELVQTILFRQLYLEEVKIAWKGLQDAYEKRTTLAQEYLASKNGDATDEMKNLTLAVKEAAGKPDMTAVERTSFVSRQAQLDELLEKGLQPSFTAGSDLSLNYIIQLGTAKEAIREATKTYNAAVLKAKLKDYPPVK